MNPIEPSAEMRAAALQLRSWFLALTAQGFSEDQALKILGAQLGSAS